MAGRKNLIIEITFGILFIGLVIMWFFPVMRDVEPESNNPASKYCLEHGGSSFVQENTMINGTKILEGICEFSNGSQCEEWKYFRGECESTS